MEYRSWGVHNIKDGHRSLHLFFIMSCICKCVCVCISICVCKCIGICIGILGFYIID